MASSTLAGLRYWTSYLVGDPQTTTFSPQMYTDAINFAIKDYAHKTGVTYTETANVVVSASGMVTIPTSYLKLNRVTYAGSELVETTINFEAMRSPTWQTDAATLPKRWLLYSGATIKLTPIVASWPGTCAIGYTDVPTLLVADSDPVDSRIPIAHNEYLKYAAAFWLLTLDGDTQDFQGGNEFMAKFNALIGYSDPVLVNKLNQMRKEGKLEE